MSKFKPDSGLNILGRIIGIYINIHSDVPLPLSLIYIRCVRDENKTQTNVIHVLNIHQYYLLNLPNLMFNVN